VEAAAFALLCRGQDTPRPFLHHGNGSDFVKRRNALLLPRAGLRPVCAPAGKQAGNPCAALEYVPGRFAASGATDGDEVRAARSFMR